MMHLCERELAVRASEEIERMADSNKCSVRNEIERLGLDRKSYYYWKSVAVAPSTFALQRMFFHGYDVIYILSGRRQEKGRRT